MHRRELYVAYYVLQAPVISPDDHFVSHVVNFVPFAFVALRRLMGDRELHRAADTAVGGKRKDKEASSVGGGGGQPVVEPDEQPGKRSVRKHAAHKHTGLVCRSMRERCIVPIYRETSLDEFLDSARTGA